MENGDDYSTVIFSEERADNLPEYPDDDGERRLDAIISKFFAGTLTHDQYDLAGTYDLKWNFYYTGAETNTFFSEPF